MKFLHVADLHLGRVFHERSLVADQDFVLAQLRRRLAEDEYAALVIAGDVYDRSIPSPEAVTLLGRFLGALKKEREDLAVLVIPGNHDSAERLGFGGELFSELGIHIVTDPRRSTEPVLLRSGNETCAFFLLPFLYAGSAVPGEDDSDDPTTETGEAAGPDDDGTEPRSATGVPGTGSKTAGAGTSGAAPARGLHTQAERAAAAAVALETARAAALAEGASAAVLVAHLFGIGGKPAESERSFLGNAERVDLSLFSRFDYVALGHLHRCQSVSPNAWYSGSPLAYSFDEAGAEKFFLAVGVGADAAPDGTPALRRLPVTPLRRVSRLEGPFASFLEDGAYAEYRDDYLELALTDREVVESPQALLRPRFPQLLSIRQEAAFASSSGVADLGGRRGSGDPGSGEGLVEDFSAFLELIRERADQEELALFAAMAKEAQSHETR